MTDLLEHLGAFWMAMLVVVPLGHRVLTHREQRAEELAADARHEAWLRVMAAREDLDECLADARARDADFVPTARAAPAYRRDRTEPTITLGRTDDTVPIELVVGGGLVADEPLRSPSGVQRKRRWW